MNRVALIVEADEPVMFFSSIGAARSYIEIYSVRDGIYKGAYDASGRRYEIRERGEDVEIASVDEYDLPGLRLIVESFLSYHGIDFDPQDSIHSLLDRCAPFIVA